MKTLRTIFTILQIAKVNTNSKLHWIYFLTLLSTFAEVLSVGTIIPLINNIDKVELTGVLRYGIDPIILSITVFTIIFFLKSCFVLWVISVQNRYAFGVQQQLSLGVFQKLIYNDYENNSQYGNDYFNSIINVDVIHFRDTLLLIILLMTELSVMFSLFIVSIYLFPVITIVISTVFLTGFICFRYIFAPISQRFGQRRISADFSKNLWLKNTLDFLDIIHSQKLGPFFAKSFTESINISSEVGAQQGTLNQAPRFLFETLTILCLAVTMVLSQYDSGIAQISPKPGGPQLLVLGMIAFRLLPSINRIVGALQGINFGHQVAMELDGLLKGFMSSESVQKSFETAPIESVKELTAIDCKKRNNGRNILGGGIAKFVVGRIYAIVGPSGSGKSYFIKTLLGLYWKTSGEIYVNGKLLTSRLIDQPNVVALVPQHGSTIQGTILDNILMGRTLDPTKMHNISPLLGWASTFPLGLNTELGPKGVALSGGQMQRVAIARAFYTEPAIIVLDESTSALDETSQNEVMKFLESRRSKHIIIFITHRTENLKFCDEIYQINTGIISLKDSMELH